MRLTALALIVSLPAVAGAEIRHHGGSDAALPHEKYVRVVSEADSPVQQAYVKTKDGLYVAAAIVVLLTALATVRIWRRRRRTGA